MIVNEQLLRNENSLSESIKRLSSGLKFNSAKDNPSGVAISYKMQAQINALDRAAANVTDGTSIVQTIDGSIGEMTDIIQRMRELCVQAANGTNTLEDREAIQEEIAGLKEEINRISADTEFNGKTLLDGSLDRRCYVTAETTVQTVVFDTAENKQISSTSTSYKTSKYDMVDNIIVSDEVQAGHYEVEISGNAKYAVATADAPDITLQADGTIGANGTITIGFADGSEDGINGYSVEITKDMTEEDIFRAIEQAGEIAGIKVFSYDGNPALDPPTEETLDTQGLTKVDFDSTKPLAFVADEYGKKTDIVIQISDKEDKEDETNTLKLSELINIEIKDQQEGQDATVQLSGSGFTEQAVVTADGNQVKITDRSGFEISFEVSAYLAYPADDVQQTTDGDIETTVTTSASRKFDIEVTDIGMLQLQVGANENQELVVRVPVLNTKSLYIEDVDVTKVDGATEGISQMDVALSIVTAARAKMGAYENSLDYAQKSLDATGENMTQAISRLMDTDMAQEMTTYTNANVLDQASISILAQANDLPQQVLSLLQG